MYVRATFACVAGFIPYSNDMGPKVSFIHHSRVYEKVTCFIFAIHVLESYQSRTFIMHVIFSFMALFPCQRTPLLLLLHESIIHRLVVPDDDAFLFALEILTR